MLQVLRQSYFFDSGVKHMGVSQTMHGISNKFLLVGTLSDQVSLHCPLPVVHCLLPMACNLHAAALRTEPAFLCTLMENTGGLAIGCKATVLAAPAQGALLPVSPKQSASSDWTNC